MLDTKKGIIGLLENDINLSPNLCKNKVLNSRIFKEYLRDEQDMMNSYYWFYFKQVALFGVNMYIGLCFYKEKLSSAHMAIQSSNYSISWSDWSKVKELERKDAHDSWLLKNIGIPPYIYSWGSITSVYDNKGASSIIIIRFTDNKS